MKNFIKTALLLILTVSLNANMLEDIKQRVRTIGKQTPIDIALYAKNPSTTCKLTITNKINPYKRDLTKTKLKPIVLEKGRYYREDINHLLKGAYEFEYSWEKDGKFVDSRLKTIRVFAYHDRTLKIHKKVDLTFLLKVPKSCK